MLGFARTSTVEEKEDEISALEGEKAELQRQLSTARSEREHLRRQRDSAEEEHQIEEETHGAALDAGEFEPLENKEDVVETLDEPRVAYKVGSTYVIELVIPANTTVVHPSADTGPLMGSDDHDKKRVGRAYVRDFYYVGEVDSMRPLLHPTHDQSRHDPSFTYKSSEFVEPDNGFNTSLNRECTAGIHCFATREEAEEYYN